MQPERSSPGPVVVLGGINCDIAARAARLTPASSTPGTVSLSAGGVARNIAHNLALLGVPVRLSGRVGADPLSSWVLQESAVAGVDVAAVERSQAAGPGVYVSLLEAGELTFAVADMAAVESIDGPAAGDLLDRCLDGRSERPSWLILDCNLLPSALQAGMDWAAARDVPLAVEPVSVEKVQRLRGLRGAIDLCTPNVDEARVLCDGSAFPVIGTMIVTRGAWGAAVADATEPNRCRLLPALAAEVRNVTGAGDAFVAAVVAARWHGVAPAEAVTWGLAAGAHTVSVAASVATDLRAALSAAEYTMKQEKDP